MNMESPHKEKESRKSKYKTTHTRTEEGMKKRNAKRRQKQKEKRQIEYARKIEEDLEKDAKIRALESKNSLLARTLKSTKTGTRVQSRKYSLPKSILDSSRNKAVHISQSLTVKPTEFKMDELQLLPELLGEGVYGKLRLGKLINFRQQVAVKEISGKSMTLDAYVESKIMLALNGHKNLPLFFGWIKPNLVLLEFIGTGSTSSPTFRDALYKEENDLNWLAIMIDISLAIKHVHDKGFLHNDIHPRNILLREFKYVKIIDFGKATLIEDPVVYNIQSGSRKQKIYNERHTHLAFELRNIPRSFQSVKTDIYSLGYNFQLVSEVWKNQKLSSLCHDMLKENPDDRPSLPQVVKKLELLKFKM